MTGKTTSNFAMFFTGNQLKILALISMTSDHIGKQLLPQYPILQIIGRLAFPIFAYMIAEGCYYTKNRHKYLFTIAFIALLCQVVYFFAMGSLYQCILVTFSLSVCMIYALDNAVKQKTIISRLTALSICGIVYFVSVHLPQILDTTDFEIDYGFFGILLSVFIYFGKNKYIKLFMAAIPLLALGFIFGGIQWYALLSFIPLAFYSGKRGNTKLKNLFYIYYPLHLVCIYFISLIV